MISSDLSTSTKWTQWGPWSSCSRSCGGGLQSRTQTACEESASCTDPLKDWRACAVEPCPTQSHSRRDEQCRSFARSRNSSDWERWKASESWLLHASPCSLDCEMWRPASVGLTEAEVTKTVKLSDIAQDGTHCGSAGELRLCLAGICRRVGCDLRLELPEAPLATLDRCGVCKGSGETCTSEESRYSWEQERDLTRTRCSATCGGGSQVFQYFCVEKQTGEKVHFGFCDPKKRPQNQFEACNRFPCPAR